MIGLIQKNVDWDKAPISTGVRKKSIAIILSQSSLISWPLMRLQFGRIALWPGRVAIIDE
jgi:hypothetical protein